MRNIVLLTLTTISIAACVAYPTQRTYFEANAEDGTPSSSASCGYHKAKHDALIRDINGLHVQVSPRLVEGSPVVVSVLFRHPSLATLAPEKFELRSWPSGTVHLPVKHDITVQKPDRTHPYHSQWVRLEFAVLPEAVTDIAMGFPAGSVSLNGTPLQPSPFRFRKTTKSDIYYASINC